MTDDEMLLRYSNRIEELREMIGRDRPVKPSIWSYAPFVLLLILISFIFYFSIPASPQDSKDNSYSSLFISICLLISACGMITNLQLQSINRRINAILELPEAEDKLKKLKESLNQNHFTSNNIYDIKRENF